MVEYIVPFGKIDSDTNFACLNCSSVKPLHPYKFTLINFEFNKELPYIVHHRKSTSIHVQLCISDFVSDTFLILISPLNSLSLIKEPSIVALTNVDRTNFAFCIRLPINELELNEHLSHSYCSKCVSSNSALKKLTFI